MQQVVIVDSSCLILLDKISELEILRKLYRYIFITTEVSKEFGKRIPQWIQIKNSDNIERLAFLETVLDLGESSSIALALEMKNHLIILDDNKARKFAIKLGLRVTGTMGVLVFAKQQNEISSIRPIIDKIKSTDFRLTEELIQQVYKLADE